MYILKLIIEPKITAPNYWHGSLWLMNETTKIPHRRKLKGTLYNIMAEVQEISDGLITIEEPIDKTHKDYSICKCGHEQLSDLTTIPECESCGEFWSMEHPNRPKPEFTNTVKKYIKE